MYKTQSLRHRARAKSWALTTLHSALVASFLVASLKAPAADAQTTESLTADLEATAARILPLSVGFALRVDGAIVQGDTLRIQLSTWKQPDPDVNLPERIANIFKDACRTRGYQDLLTRGATIAYDLTTPSDERLEMMALTAASCGFAPAAAPDTQHDRRVTDLLERLGLEKTLLQFATTESATLIYDGVSFQKAVAIEKTLRISVSDRGARDLKQVRGTVLEFVCRDSVLRTLLDAGARIIYLINDVAFVSIKPGDCDSF